MHTKQKIISDHQKSSLTRHGFIEVLEISLGVSKGDLETSENFWNPEGVLDTCCTLKNILESWCSFQDVLKSFKYRK